MSQIQSTRHAPTFTAFTTIMPPQQSQSGVASALAPLDLLAGLAGGAAGITSPGERYVALIQSARAQLARTEQAADALHAAGGIAKDGRLYATEFTRERVRVSQQLKHERVIRDFENPDHQRMDHAPLQYHRGGLQRVQQPLDRTASKRPKPTGRIVLQLTPTTEALQDLVLEDDDRLSVLVRPTTVGVFGSVFSVGSCLDTPGRTVDNYLRLAGGPTRGADQTSVLVIRASGAVNSSLQESGFLSRGNQIAGIVAEPGDNIFVPEELDKCTWTQRTKDWTKVIYQFGIGLAGLKSALR